ncbi:MAG: molybdenum ABC transporter ATP-binding protein, partial [Planctomycetia bacterium]|nr:molybdenum ABC transporter ATP-binding protein [Planctomycetia bacterium]
MTNWSAQFEFSRGDIELKVDLQGADRPLALIGANGAGKTTVL